MARKAVEKLEILEDSAEIAEISSKTSKTVVVESSMRPEDVVKLDAEGAELLFDQKEGFLLMPEDLLRTLSRENRARYSVARQFHDTWRGDTDEEFQRMFSVEKEFVGSASDKLNKLEVRDNLHARWARPDKVRDYMAKGYKVLSADDATSFLGTKGGHHEIGRNGKTDLILMGIPKELHKKHAAEKVRKNNEAAMQWAASGVSDIQKTGAKGFVASEDDSRRKWNDIE